ncbi:MAG TPA: cytochrome c biogenesis protein CcdA, partial [Acidimicrobiales bacterium]|nr:cytochrome c biogenesis protein CcdA [Acidimicrobiales bacterium]
MAGYLSYVSAIPVKDLDARSSRGVVLRASLLFVAGFTIVFTAFGATASALGATMLGLRPPHRHHVLLR